MIADVIMDISPPDKYNDFIEANRIEDASERMKTLRKLVCSLNCWKLSQEEMLFLASVDRVA